MKHAPANGWDVRAEGRLPAWPHLGGKLVYEQYWHMKWPCSIKMIGSNPHAITAGLNYTPFPLMTFSAEQRQGKQGEMTPVLPSILPGNLAAQCRNSWT